jgi:hypothetical protein
MFAAKKGGHACPPYTPLAASPAAQAKSHSLAATNHHDGQITQKPVKSVWKKYSDFPK